MLKCDYILELALKLACVQTGWTLSEGPSPVLQGSVSDDQKQKT
jgi:hypothetical protein